MKPTLSALEARERLEREFARLKAAACRTCTAPAPFWGPAVMAGPGYWYLKALPPCPHECHQVLAQAWSFLTTEFDIERPAGDGRLALGAPRRGKKAAVPVERQAAHGVSGRGRP